MSVKHTTQNIKSTKPFLFSVPTGEVESFCADLSGRLHINTAVRMSVDKLHDLLFSADTNFIQHLFSQRHFTGRENTHTHLRTQIQRSQLCNCLYTQRVCKRTRFFSFSLFIGTLFERSLRVLDVFTSPGTLFTNQHRTCINLLHKSERVFPVETVTVTAVCLLLLCCFSLDYRGSCQWTNPFILSRR